MKKYILTRKQKGLVLITIERSKFVCWKLHDRTADNNHSFWRFSAKSIFAQLFICRHGENDTINMAIHVDQFAAPCYISLGESLVVTAAKVCPRFLDFIRFSARDCTDKGERSVSEVVMNFEGICHSVFHISCTKLV